MTATDLKHLRGQHSMLVESRDELSYAIKDLEAEIEAAERALIPRGVEVEIVVREAIKSRWPHYNVRPFVTGVFDVFVVSLED